MSPGETPAAVPPDLIAALDARRARLGGFAAFLRYFKSVGSTNDVAARLADAGAPHGAAVIAVAQERGRGRMGRGWFSPPGSGLYVSVVLRPAALGAGFGSGASGASVASSVTLSAGVAVAEAIREVSGLRVEIKWPNDLVVGRRKLCGILAEASAAASGLQHVVLGFGINLRAAGYPPDLAGRATSIEEELGRPVDEQVLLAEALARLSETISGLPVRGLEAVLRRWRELSPSASGARVEVLAGAGRWEIATTAGIDDDGALLVTRAGSIHRVIAGEVRWL
ncbi:MAG TPA: biotin--[acetyl-CoA-carboxylase] ligase [Vicinamibacterales bacterium]|nr:biotin--[acetyl-CoA-carboxylase] ligase [Acidobacteriota bacterium]HOC18120.1 biotin--[acetyl-CoA-carboxylase] ligase [Vicinamibacterales bacterium]